MKIIVAVDKEWGIGYKGDLLIRIKNDLLNFKSLTVGKTVICGSNTVATFPGGRALKNRTSIVLNPSPDYKVEGAEVAHSIEEALEMVKGTDTNDVIVIGGASVYRQMLPYCDECIVTRIERSFDKDVWFPNLDEDADWCLAVVGETMLTDESTDGISGIKYHIDTYKRRSK